MKKILWIDLETTDNQADRNGGIHEIAYIIDIDGKVVCERAFKCAPFKNDLVNAQSLDVCGLTLADIKKYPPSTDAFQQLMKDIEPYKPIVLGGYNNAIFDNKFFQKWIYKCANELKIRDFNPLNIIHFDPLDVRTIAVDHFLDKRDELFGFKLADIAKYLNIPIEDSKLHGALYDIRLTRQIYYKIKSK